jgi:hypothetical protein
MIGCMDNKVFALPFALQKIRRQAYAWTPVTWLSDRRRDENSRCDLVCLGEFFRRMKFPLGTPQAITATAHNWLASFVTCCESISLIPKAPSPTTMNGPSHVLRPGCEEKPPDLPMCSYHKKRLKESAIELRWSFTRRVSPVIRANRKI